MNMEEGTVTKWNKNPGERFLEKIFCIPSKQKKLAMKLKRHVTV